MGDRSPGGRGAVDDGRVRPVRHDAVGLPFRPPRQPQLLFWYYGLREPSLFRLPYSTFTLLGLSTFAMFYGPDWAATVPPKLAVA